MTFVSQTQFHVERLWGQRGSSRFQPGEGPSRGLLRDYEPSDGPFSSTICLPVPVCPSEQIASFPERTIYEE